MIRDFKIDQTRLTQRLDPFASQESQENLDDEQTENNISMEEDEIFNQTL